MPELRFQRTKSQCKLCALNGCRRVWADLPPAEAQGCSILVLSEAPGEAEDRLGHVLIGPAGGFFNWATGQVGLRRDRMWLTNVVCCRPPQNEISSREGMDAVASCALGLREELFEAWNRGYRTILAQGQTAIEALGISGSIHTMRGSVVEGKVLEAQGLPGFRVVCTFHPANVLRHDTGRWDMKPTYISDLEKLKLVSAPGWAPTAEDFWIEPGVADIFRWLEEVPDDSLIGADIETDSLSRHYGEIVCLSLARSPSNVICIPWRHHGRDDFYFSEREREIIVEALEKFFARVRLVFQNGAFDGPYIRLKLCKIPKSAFAEDTYLLHSLVSPETEHNLGFITSIYGTTPYWKDDFKNRPGSIYAMNPRDLWQYNARDSSVLMQILPLLWKDMDKLHLRDQYYQETMPFFREVILEMTETGVGFDFEHMEKFKTHMDTIVAERETRLRKLGSLPASFTFTGQQLQWSLFDKRPKYIAKDLESLQKHETEIASVAKALEEFRQGLSPTKMTPKGREKAIALKEASLARKQGLKCLAEERISKELSETVKPLYVLAGYDGILTDSGEFSVGKDGVMSYKARLERELAERDERIEKHSNVLELSKLSSVQRLQRETWLEKAEAESEQIGKLLEFLDLLIERSGLQKLQTSFTKYKPLPDGRVYPSWNAGGTSTGRPTCQNPNLLQLPKGDDDETAGLAKHEALEVRRSFIPRPGYGIATADFENAEVALFGYETGDEIITEIYLSGGKIHNINTRTLFGLNPDDPGFAAAKAGAKIFQFGRYQYGGGLRTVARQIRLKAPGLHVSMKELQAADERWWTEHPAVKLWSDKTEAEAFENRIVYNAFGRARMLLGDKQGIGREAKSFLIQGGIGCIINRASIRIAERKAVEAPDARIIMHYYDQLVYEAPLGPQLDSMCRLLKEELERPFDYRGVMRHIRAEVEYSKKSFGDLFEWKKEGDAL